MKETNCKDWAIEKTEEIIQICNDLKYIDNKQLRVLAINRIDYLASRILEHLDYLDLKESEDK